MAEDTKRKDDFKKHFGEKLKTLRDHVGVSQEQMARDLRLNPQTIVNYEGGKSVPDTYILYELGEYLNVDFNTLVNPVIGKVRLSEDPFGSVIRLLQSARDLGVIGIYPNRSVALEQFVDILEIESDEVFIVGSSIKGIFEPIPRFLEILKECITRGAKVKVVLTNPFLSFLRESIEGRPSGAIWNEIREAWEKLSRKDLRLTESTRLSIKFFSGTPTVFLIGTSRYMLLNPYSSGDVAYRTFCLQVEKTHHVDCIYNVYKREHFERTYHEASEDIPRVFTKSWEKSTEGTDVKEWIRKSKSILFPNSSENGVDSSATV